MISAKETYKIASATSRVLDLNKRIQSVIKVKPRKVHKLGPEHMVVNRTPKLESPVADSVAKPSGLKEYFQTYWPHYAVAGAAGIGGLAYLKSKRDKQNAVA